MDDKTILIVGAHGQLGKALSARFPRAKAVDRDTFDMTDWNMLEAYDWSGVKYILNAAAYTNVDEAETPEGRVATWKINATGPGYLAKITAQHDITLVHVSTDYVFDGTKTPHPEDEPYSPLGVYGQSKAAGDIAVSTAPKHYILRIQALIGEGHNFVRIMTGLAEKNIHPSVVEDQITRLTFTPTLVDGIHHLLTTKAPYGIYNLTNDGEPDSWANIARMIFAQIGREDITVTGVSTADYFKSKPHVAPRPLKSYFDLSKIKTTGLTLTDWHDELRAYIANEQKKEA